MSPYSIRDVYNLALYSRKFENFLGSPGKFWEVLDDSQIPITFERQL